MCKKLFFVFCLALGYLAAIGQPAMSAKEMVAISPMLSQELDLQESIKSSLQMKLTQMVTQNGFGSTSGQFVLTANVVVVDKQATTTAPAQYIVNLEVSVYVLNVIEELIIDEMSFSVKGVDRLENKAMIQAINQIKPKSPAVRNFMEGCRSKIVEYYNTQVPTLITKAQSLADRNQYEEALSVLSAIPETVEQYALVADRMTAIYIKLQDRNATTAIQEAQGKIALRDYESALNALLKVDPSSSKSKEVFAMIESIKKGIDAKEQAEMEKQFKLYEEQLRQYEERKEATDETILSKVQSAVGLKIGDENLLSSPSLTGSLMGGLNKWFLGKFK